MEANQPAQGLALSRFLAEYWQKKPCVIRQFIPDFTDPIDEHDLAGLAQEEDVDSRLVSYYNDAWQLTQGPIEDFAPLCKGAWSLLVQGVERYIPGVEVLTRQVEDIGHWRMDDVMVSFSNAGAGVGPHIDQYDVFIIQGKGSRRWKVGEPDTYLQTLPHPMLKQIEGFDAIIDEVLLPGDAIYIPPQHPHDGVALEDCLNYSIGFRAPSNLEALSGIVDEGESLQTRAERYQDPHIAELRRNVLNPSEVSQSELNSLKQSIVSLLDTQEAQFALLKFLSHQGLPDTRPEPLYNAEEVSLLLSEQGALCKTLGVKAIYASEQRGDFSFFIDGHPYTVPVFLRDTAVALIDSSAISCPIELSEKELKAFTALIHQLLNDGYWMFESDH